MIEQLYAAIEAKGFDISPVKAGALRADGFEIVVSEAQHFDWMLAMSDFLNEVYGAGSFTVSPDESDPFVTRYRIVGGDIEYRARWDRKPHAERSYEQKFFHVMHVTLA